MTALLGRVQWISISALADRWHLELRIPLDVVARELRRGWYKWQRIRPGGEFQCGRPLKNNPGEDELPSEATEVDRAFLIAFCREQQWPAPRFFPLQVRAAQGQRGRPSCMSAIVQEMERRAKGSDLEKTVTAESRCLHRWARDHHPDLAPSERSIRNHIGERYKRLKTSA